MINIYNQPLDVVTTSDQWWFVVRGDLVIVPPLKSYGSTTSPHALIIGDTLEECQQYISDNNLIIVDTD